MTTTASPDTTPGTLPDPAGSTVDLEGGANSETCTLDIGGMTCASCVGRIEKALLKLDGVADARVNLATEVASITYDPDLVRLDDLTGAVAKAGYSATPRHQPTATGGRQRRTGAAESASSGDERRGEARDRELSRMKRKWQTALATGLGLMGLMYVPLYIDTMDWLMPVIFVVATAVQWWAGKDIYASAWAAAKHRTTNMTTLVALGTGVAWGYSTFVTLWPAPRRTGRTAAARLLRDLADHRRARPGREVDGRPGPRSAPPPPSPPWSGWHRRPPASSATASRSTFPSRTSWSATSSASAPARRSPSTASSSPAPPRWTSRMLTGESLPVDKTAGDPVIGATLNTTGSVQIQVTAVGDDTALAQIIRLVEDAQGSKVPMQRLADKVSSVFVPAVILAAFATFVALGSLRAGHREPDHGHHHHHRGPHHRLPLRPGAGHADRGHGRHRPRRRARHPHLQRRSPRAGPPPHRGRARQDRHHHPRQARPDRHHHHRRVRRRPTSWPWSPRPRAAASTPSPRPSPPTPTPPASPCRRWTRSTPSPATGSTPASTGTGSGSATAR